MKGWSRWEEIAHTGEQEREWSKQLRPERKDLKFQARELALYLELCPGSYFGKWSIERTGWRNRNCIKSHLSQKQDREKEVAKMPERWHLLNMFDLMGADESEKAKTWDRGIKDFDPQGGWNVSVKEMFLEINLSNKNSNFPPKLSFLDTKVSRSIFPQWWAELVAQKSLGVVPVTQIMLTVIYVVSCLTCHTQL